jgi:hypothetical protein
VYLLYVVDNGWSARSPFSNSDHRGRVGGLAALLTLDIKAWLEEKVQVTKIGNLDVSWLSAIQVSPSVYTSSETLKSMYSNIQTAIEDKQYSVIDNIFSSLQVEKTPVDAMIALLRYSYIEKERFRNWEALLNRATVELDRRGIDSKKIFRGLYASNTKN